jgi:hypothetical protein
MTLAQRLELLGHLARSVGRKFSDGFYFQIRVAFSALVIGGCGYVGYEAGASWIGVVVGALLVIAALLTVEWRTQMRSGSLPSTQSSPPPTITQPHDPRNRT